MAMKLKESIRTARAGLIESTINTEEGAAPYLCFYTGAPPAARAADMTNYLENKLVDALFRGVSYTMPTTLAVALHTAACSDSSAGTEVTTSGSTGYLRVALNPSTSNWASTGGAGTTTNPKLAPRDEFGWPDDVRRPN